MKLAAMKCSRCEATPDDADPNWEFADGEWWHYCDPDVGILLRGRGVLRRSADRTAAIDDERIALADASRRIERDRLAERRARTAASLKRGSTGGS